MTSSLAAPRPRAAATASALLALLAIVASVLVFALPARAEASGSLVWSVKSSFRGYLQGSGGTITASGGATDAAGKTTWPAASSSVGSSGLGTVNYGGSLNFTYAPHGINITLADPRITITGEGTAVMSVSTGAERVDFVNINLGAATRTEDGGIVTYTNATTTFTAAASEIFIGSYAPGSAADPLTFSFPAPPAPDPSATPSPTASAEPTATPEPSVTPEPSATPEPSPKPTQTSKPKPPAQDQKVVGRLTWGVSSAWRSYITGPIANGTISVSGASYSGSTFTWVQTGGKVDAAKGTGTASYGGAVRFTGHRGVLERNFSAPQVRLTGKTTAAIDVTVNGTKVTLATVNLGAAKKTALDGAVRYSGAPATLTAAATWVFLDYYPAGFSLDPVTVTFGVGTKAVPAGGTKVVAAAADAGNTGLPSTPPATTGLELDDATLADLLAGKSVTVTGAGFAPGERVSIVIYSTPTLLGTTTANEKGVATWTGAIPATFTGEHTLVFIGGETTAKGIALSIPDRAQVADMCLATDATLTWGFKESFRAYIDSTLANGGWTVDGVTDDVGIFTWSGGSGGIDPATGLGSIGFAGSIEFTGHEGVLDTTFSNPRIEFSADGAFLLLDVVGETRDGQAVNATAVRFASLDIDAATADAKGDIVLLSEIPATLTEDGSAAFGTYPAGEALDPITLTATGAQGCLGFLAGEDPSLAPTAQPSPIASPTDTSDAEGDSGSSLTWLWFGIGAVALAAVVGVVAFRRGKASR